jgi:hypothetical protein
VPVGISSLQPYVVRDVRWDYPVLGKGENGWELAEKATAIGSRVRLGPVDWKLISAPWLTSSGPVAAEGDRVIRDYAVAIALENEALRSPRWVAPPVPDLLPISKRAWAMADDFPNIAGHKWIAKALVVRAYSGLSRGDEMAAVRDLAMIEQIGSRFASGDGLFIDHLVGIAIEAIGHAAIRRAIEEGQISGEGAAYLLRVLPDRRDASRLVGSMQREFHDRFLANLASMGANPTRDDARVAKSILIGHPNRFDLPDTVRTASKIYAVMLEDMAKPFGKRREIAPIVASLFHELPAFMRDEGAPQPKADQILAMRAAFRRVKNPVGKQLIALLLPTFEAGQQGELEALADRRATRFMLQRILDRAAKASLDPFGDGRLRVR